MRKLCIKMVIIWFTGLWAVVQFSLCLNELHWNPTLSYKFQYFHNSNCECSQCKIGREIGSFLYSKYGISEESSFCANFRPNPTNKLKQNVINLRTNWNFRCGRRSIFPINVKSSNSRIFWKKRRVWNLDGNLRKSCFPHISIGFTRKLRILFVSVWPCLVQISEKKTINKQT